MSKRHFLLYDFLLPLLGILAAGRFLSDQFDTAVFRWVDSIQTMGIGAWFRSSPVRPALWADSWLAFSAAPALLWLVWLRVNVEYDYVERARRLDRPLYFFVRGVFRWIDGADKAKWQMQYLQFRLAQAEERAGKLEKDLGRARKAYSELAADYDDLEAQVYPDGEAGDPYQPAAGLKAG